jgi:hypothetical protein
MPQLLGDYVDNATVSFEFNVFDSNGEPVGLMGTLTESVEVYKSGSTTAHTQAYTPAALGSLTGVYRVTIDMGANAFFETGKNYVAILTGGSITADGTAVTNTVLAEWSCQNRTANIPDGGITADTFASGLLSDDADIATAVGTELAGDFSAIPNAVVSATGIPLSATSATHTTTSVAVDNATSLSATQLDDALVLHLATGAYSRITGVAGTAPNLTLTLSPALPGAPADNDVLVVYGKYLASL